GLLIKAAVALVVGGVATGLGVERSTHAAAPPAAATKAPSAVQVSASAPPAARVANPHRIASARSARAKSVRRTDATGSAHRPSLRHREGPLPATASDSSASGSPAQSPSTAGAATVVTQAAQTVVQTADQTVTAVAAALPVSVPQVPPLPVQPPPVPKLP